MANVYQTLGVPTIINAVGPATRLSGSIMAPQVAEAMVEASQHCVDIAQLQARASELIAEVTGAEAGYVTSGAAAGLLLATAACVTGLDPLKMNRLPDTSGMKSEVVIARSQRNFYDHAVRTVGVSLVEVGIADRFSGAGIRDAEAWEFAAAIGEQTAAVVYVSYAHSLPELSDVVEVAHAADVPVVVDAAGQLPPASNLHRFIDEGADLVAFSGGKAIRGPQSSGILCGRRDLISAVALQHLDQDVLSELWQPPPNLIDRSQIPGAPQHGIGRPCKVGKEEIVGLLTALELFVQEDPEERRRSWTEKLEALRAAIGELRHVEINLVADRKRSEIPVLQLRLDEEAAGMSALNLVLQLQESEPSIYADAGQRAEGVVAFRPLCLRPGDEEVIAQRLRQLLA